MTLSKPIFIALALCLPACFAPNVAAPADLGSTGVVEMATAGDDDPETAGPGVTEPATSGPAGTSVTNPGVSGSSGGEPETTGGEPETTSTSGGATGPGTSTEPEGTGSTSLDPSGSSEETGEPLMCPVSGLRLWYRMDDDDGNAVDSSGCGLDGTVTGTTQDVAGIEGSAFQFSDPDDLVFVDDGGALSGLDEVTVEAWVNRDSTTHLDGVVSLGNAMGGDTFIFAVWTDGSLSVSLGFPPACTGMSTYGDDSGALVGTGWHHIAFTFDTATPVISYYVDGELVGTQNAAAFTDLCDTADGLHVGSVNGDGAWGFEGIIDEVKLWNVVRDEQDICEDAGGSWSDGCDL